MSRKYYFLVVMALLVQTAPVSAKPPSGYQFLSYDQAIKNAKRSGKKIFIYYGREGCGYCDMTNRDTFSKRTVKRLYEKNYELVYIDAEGGNRLTLPSGERITEQQFGAKQKVLGTPYFMFLEPDGRPIFKAPGYKTEKDLLQFDEYIQGGFYKTKSFGEYSK